jgi:hypothetical protein
MSRSLRGGPSAVFSFGTHAADSVRCPRCGLVVRERDLDGGRHRAPLCGQRCGRYTKGGLSDPTVEGHMPGCERCDEVKRSRSQRRSSR